MSARLPARLPGRSPARRAARWPAALALAAAVGLTAAACSSSSGSGSPAGASGSTSAAAPSASGGGAGVPAAVSTHGTTNLGTVFADSSGRTLYAADQEAGGKISCTGGCLQFWHPVLATAGASSTGGGFGSVERPDTGKSQLTYSGKPVYTFAEDAAPGDTKGDGAKDAFGGKQFTWHALPAIPSAATSAPPASTGSGSSGSSGGSGGGYGY